MDIDITILAANAFTVNHRFLWFDWSYLDIIGGFGAIIFSMRFLVQWIASEKAGDSVVPRSFWYWSIAGTVVMLFYFICERSFIGTLLYLPNTCVYLRNLVLIKKKEERERNALAEQKTPAEMAHQ